MAYIYKITNLINQHSYIGKTEHTDPINRWKEHLHEVTKERNAHRSTYRAIRKYGKENFSFEVIEETSNPEEREKYYIQYYDTYNNGYNETIGGDGASYLQLPEKEICHYYSTHSLKETAEFFGHDKDTISRVLYKNQVKIRTRSEQRILASSYPVAQIDPKTNEVIKIFASVAEAEQATGNTHHISDAISGKRKTCKGYLWRKVEQNG